LLWSHDRGLVSLASFTLPLFALRLRLGSLLVGLSTFALTLALLGAILQGLSLNHLIANILFLLRTGKQWQYPTDLSVIGLAGVSIGVNAVILLLLGRRIYDLRRQPEKLAVLLFVALSLLAFMKIGLNRVDLQHAKMTLWAPLFALPLIAFKGLSDVLPLASHPKVRITLGLGSLLLVPLFLNTEVGRYLFVPFLLICLIFALKVHTRLQRGFALLAIALSFSFLLTNIIRPARAMLAGKAGIVSVQNWGLSDEHAVSGSIAWAANALREAGANCVFDMTNSGLINAYSKLPACTQFSYPVYAGAEDEAGMIATIAARKPAAIVISGAVDSYKIDDISMPERFPALSAQLEQDYRHQICQFGYCIGYLASK
jgi:hypothetical protein